jgi:hypothetical protein
VVQILSIGEELLMVVVELGSTGVVPILKLLLWQVLVVGVEAQPVAREVKADLVAHIYVVSNSIRVSLA